MIINGNALEEVEKLNSNSIDMCITSPPYYRLRDYGIDGQVGLEETPDDYVEHLCVLFDKIYDRLKNKGSLWVNIGDSYNSTNRSYKADKKWCEKVGFDKSFNIRESGQVEPNRKPLKQFKTKTLLGIPFRFAAKMIDRGWILRNTIIWHKPYCIPSSAKDRYTVDFEYMFFFTKSNSYYFKTQYEQSTVKGKKDLRIKRTVWNIAPSRFPEAHFATFPEELLESPIDACCPKGGIVLDPFFGSGTTGIVAIKQNKNFVGIELNPEYIEIAKKRLKPFMNLDNFFD